MKEKRVVACVGTRGTGMTSCKAIEALIENYKEKMKTRLIFTDGFRVAKEIFESPRVQEWISKGYIEVEKEE